MQACDDRFGDPARWVDTRGWASLDPRRHFAAALGWVVFLLVIAGAVISGEVVAGRVERQVIADNENRLEQEARLAADALFGQVQARLAAMQIVARFWQPGAGGEQRMDVPLLALQERFPELSWIGLVDRVGEIRASVGDAGNFSIFRDPAWRERAERSSLLAFQRGGGGQDADLLVLAVPVTAADGSAGELVARLPWLWLQAELDARLRSVAGGARMDVMLLDASGRVMAGDGSWRSGEAAADLGEHGRYLVGRTRAPAAGGGAALRPDWQVVLREESGPALARAGRAHDTVLYSVLAVGLLVAAAAVLMVHRLLRRLNGLIRQVQVLQGDTSGRVAVPDGRDEIHVIGHALARLVDQLQAEKRALVQLNTELDERVAQRTARIGELSRQASAAAIAHERLRVARAVHDTLAQSMIALLTQIRLVRKFAPTWDPARLDAELASAEQVAGDGLVEVRSEIGRMREQGLPGSDLGTELRLLFDRFSERSGIATQVHLDLATGGLAGPAATLILNMMTQALRNVEQHAGAGLVRVILEPDRSGAITPDDASRRWRLELADDGVGFDVRAVPAGRFGLAGLREQAAELGAELLIDSAVGRGTRLEMRFAA